VTLICLQVQCQDAFTWATPVPALSNDGRSAQLARRVAGAGEVLELHLGVLATEDDPLGTPP
jgi:hypothetical protein